MEDILEDFNDNLKNVKKIYGSISDAITGNQGGKETVVKISLGHCYETETVVENLYL